MKSALKGKVAVITGVNSGIGLAIAKRFVSEGAQAYITGRRPAELDAAVAAIGANATGVRSDVGDLADLDALSLSGRLGAPQSRRTPVHRSGVPIRPGP